MCTKIKDQVIDIVLQPNCLEKGELLSSGLETAWAGSGLTGAVRATLASITRATHTCACAAVSLAISSALALRTTVTVLCERQGDSRFMKYCC